MSRYAQDQPQRTVINWKRNGEGKIILKSEEYNFHLNHTGSEIFEMCKGKITVEKIVDSLSDKYKEIPREIIENDVDTFLESLERNKCIIIRWDPL